MVLLEKMYLYFDHMANTAPDPRVVDAMKDALLSIFGNPLSLHESGKKTDAAIEDARGKISNLIGASPKEIIFTSCGSESNNFAVRGLAKANAKKGKHIVTSTIEHFSVHYPLRDLEKEGFSVTYVPVDKFGMIDPAKVAGSMTPETILVTLTHASNEIGTIEPISEIGKIVKEKGAVFHVDAVQTAGTIPLDVKELGADAISFSSNQFYGPTGVAALYLKKGTRIIPFILGGMQEDGKRGGTHNIAGIVGMGKACELAKQEMGSRIANLIPLRDRLLQGLGKNIKDIIMTGHPEKRLPGHASCCIKFIEGESMSLFLDMEGIAVSTGSACASKALKASHVLLAIGIDAENIHGSLVMSLGKDNSMQDVDMLLEKLPPIVERLRKLSPLGKK
ncbi:MAG: cysteine desulfurase family protein [Candidatus Margulisiibacteriota bacterium]